MVCLGGWATDVVIAAREAVVVLPAAAGKVLSHCWVYRRGSCAGDTCLVVCSTAGDNIHVSRCRLISTLPVIGTVGSSNKGLGPGLACSVTGGAVNPSLGRPALAASLLLRLRLAAANMGDL